MFNDTRPWLRSLPLRVHWAGWESDTLKLQQSGWQLSAQQHVADDYMRLAIQHRDWGAQGLSEMASGIGYLQRYHRGGYGPDIRFEMRLGKSIHVQGLPSIGQAPVFTAIDAVPQLYELPVSKLEDFAHFATPLVRTQEIILPNDESVDDLLARILEKQQSARRSYFEEQVAREGSQRQKFHAQIVTLADRRVA